MALNIKGAKAGQKKPRKPNIQRDGAASISRVKILYGVSEGEIEGLVNGPASIKLEGTPLVDENGKSNFDGVEWDFRSGTNDQEYIKGFPDVSNEIGVGVELREGTPFVRAFNNTQLSAIRVRLKWGRLAKTNADNGDVSGVKIDYAIDLQTDGGSYTEVIKTKIEDKTSAGYERTHRIDLPRATKGWQIRVRRLTPNSDSDLIQDDMFVDAVAEVIDVKLRYPNTALIGLQYNAETFSSVAKMSALLRGRKIKIPVNYDPVTRKYTGLWNGLFKVAYSNNPAWIYYDLLTQWRYGLGDRIDASMIDKWTLYSLGQYCDQMVDDGQGGVEPRFTCNVYLQTQADAYQVLSNLAGLFRSLSFWNGEKIVLSADLPQDPVYTFTAANVIKGEFRYTGTRARDRHTLARVAWDNPANGFNTEYEFVRDEKAMAKFGVNVLELNGFGVTSRGQAYRLGRAALATEQLEPRQVSFAVGLDGMVKEVQVGSIVNIADAIFAGRANGGRVSAIKGSVITLDREITAGDVLIINGKDGKAERREIINVSGRRVTVLSPFKNAEVENVFAVETADLNLMRFRIMSITQNDDLTFNINAIQHEPQKFNAIDFGFKVEPAPISIINPDVVSAPQAVTLSSRDRVVQGQTVTTLIITWSQVKAAAYYDVEWRKDNGTWIKLPRTANTSAEVDGIYSGTYQVRVRSVSAFDVLSAPTMSAAVAIEAKKNAPEALAALTAKGELFAIKLEWKFQASHGDAAFTEIETADAPNTNVVPLGLFAYPTTTHTVGNLAGSVTRYFRARVVDKLGFRSPWTAWASATSDDNPEKVLDLLNGSINESILAEEFKKKIDQIEPLGNLLGNKNDPNTVLGQLEDVKRRYGDDQKLIDTVEAAINKETNNQFKTFAEYVAEDGRLRGIVERDLGTDQNGELFGKLTGVFNRLGPELWAGDEDRWAGDDEYFSGVWSIEQAFTEGDYLIGQRIDGVASQVNDNQAQITEVSKTAASANEVTAQKLTSLKGQLVGGSDSINLEDITSGLIFDEMKLRLQQDEALAERISLLSVGVGESFDPFMIWHFDDSAEGWTGGVFNPGYYNARTDAVTSPKLEIDVINDDGETVKQAISTARYHHIKLRVIKVGNPTWSGVVSWSGGTVTIPEPIFAVTTGIAIVDHDLAWGGSPSTFSITLASAADNLNYYKIDWITVGAPSPAASSAQVARIDQVSATRYASAARSVQLLEAEILGDGKEKKSLAQIRTELKTAASDASSSAEAINGLSTAYNTDLKTFYADTLGTENSLSTKLGAVSTKLDGVFTQITDRWAGDEDRWAGDDEPEDAVGSWSLNSAIIEGDMYLGERIDTVAAKQGENEAAIQEERRVRLAADSALAELITQAQAKYEENTASYKKEVQTYADKTGAYAGAVETFQATVAGYSQSVQIFTGAVNGASKAAADEASKAAQAAKEAAGKAGEASGAASTAATEAGKATGAASTAVEEAAAAKQAAEAARGAASQAGGAATDAKDAASTAAGQAAEAAAAAGTAATEASKASGAASTAATEAGKASGAAATAEQKATTAATEAGKAATSAGTAATEASKAAASAATATQKAAAAQQEAATAKTAAQTSAAEAAAAKTAAETSKKAAEDAAALVSQVAADNKFTPTEKKQVALIWSEIKNADSPLRLNADAFGVSYSAYGTKYEALRKYIEPKLNDKTATDTIVRDTFNKYFADVYSTRAEVEKLIAAAAKKKAEDAAAAAKTADGKAVEAAGGLATLINGDVADLKNNVADLGVQYTIKIDAGDRIVGFGLAKQAVGSKNYDFAIRADRFYIAGSQKYDAKNIPLRAPFVVQPDDMVVDGITVPKGVYIDTASIAKASIGEAHIKNAAITSAKIGTAQVDTLQIAGEAVITPRLQFTAGVEEIRGAVNKEVEINRVSVDAKGGAVAISFGFERLTVSDFGNQATVVIRIKRDGETIRQFDFPDKYNILDYSYVTIPTYLDRPPSGEHTYTVTMTGTSQRETYITTRITSRSLQIMGVKR